MVILFTQLVYVIKDVTKVKATLNGLKGKCPVLGNRKDDN